MTASLSLFCSLVVRGALEREILPAHAAATGVEVEASFEPTVVLLRMVDAGATPDVIVGTTDSFAALAERGVVEQGSETPLVRSGIGIAVAAGVEPPEIADVDSLVRTLLDARSVAYSRTGASGIYFATLIERLGIAERIDARATVIEKGFTGCAVVDGRASLAVQQLSELAFVDGVQIVGPLPQEVQRHTAFAVAPGAAARGRPEAAELVRALTGDLARAAYVREHLEAL